MGERFTIPFVLNPERVEESKHEWANGSLTAVLGCNFLYEDSPPQGRGRADDSRAITRHTPARLTKESEITSEAREMGRRLASPLLYGVVGMCQSGDCRWLRGGGRKTPKCPLGRLQDLLDFLGVSQINLEDPGHF